MSEQYRDVDGNECSLDELCRRDPAWAANRLRVAEARIRELEAALEVSACPLDASNGRLSNVRTCVRGGTCMCSAHEILAATSPPDSEPAKDTCTICGTFHAHGLRNGCVRGCREPADTCGIGVDDVTRWASWVVHTEGAAGVPAPTERVSRIASAVTAGMLAAGGDRFSGRAMKAAQRFGQGIASQEYGQHFNRLAGLAGTGQTAVGQSGVEIDAEYDSEPAPTPKGGEGALEAFERLASWINDYPTSAELANDLHAVRRALSEPAGDPTDVPVPLNVDHAKGMVLIGMDWLKENAPEEVKQPAVPESVYRSAVQGRADFRAALRQERDKLKAVRRLPDAWRADAMGYDEDDDSQNTFAAAINYCADELDRALAQSEQGRVPKGWKLVPVEPTIAMADAADKTMRDYAGMNVSVCNRALKAYGAMLAAAPQPQDGERDD